MSESDSNFPLKISRPQPGCAVVTLNRPKALNALSSALRRALVQTVNDLALDEEVRVLVITGEGQAFCAGLDLRELATHGMPALNDADDPVAALLACPKPVIGAVNGATVTGGLELALACDFLIASTNARFADTHARIGVIPGWGLSQKLSRIVGLARAKEMSLSGNFIDAECAERWGLVNRVVQPQTLHAVALALAADMATAEPGMLQTYKRLIDDGYSGTLDAGMKIEAQLWADWSASLTSQAFAARRSAVLDRGREQQLMK